MKGKNAFEKAVALRELKQNPELIPAVAARQKAQLNVSSSSQQHTIQEEDDSKMDETD